MLTDSCTDEVVWQWFVTILIECNTFVVLVRNSGCAEAERGCVSTPVIALFVAAIGEFWVWKVIPCRSMCHISTFGICTAMRPHLALSTSHKHLAAYHNYRWVWQVNHFWWRPLFVWTYHLQTSLQWTENGGKWKSLSWGAYASVIMTFDIKKFTFRT